MSISQTDPIRHYLDQLQRITTDLPPGQQSDLLASIEEHLADAAARQELPAALNRLGTPEEVGAAAHLNSDHTPSRPRRSWVSAAVIVTVAATAAGFTLLGAVMSVTARFDDGADWNLHPALALAGMGVGLLVGILVSVVVVASHTWNKSEKAALIGLWGAAMLVAVIGSEVAGSTAPGVGFLLAAVQLLLGGVIVIAVFALFLRARSPHSAQMA